jgi:2-keto-4-pentenoate hydratase/2-oxohepta-3-ene-1,7-dioic acid hydratase in catechol pathway
MRLVRWGEAGSERPGLLDADGVLRDLCAVLADIGPAVLAPESLARLAALDPAALPRVVGSPRLGAPLAGVGKLVGIGLNYRDHAQEAGMAQPAEPVIFMKAATAIAGPNDPLPIPPDSRKTDWEVELAVVIGSPARRVSRQAALAHVAGYCVANDVSERAYQLERGGTWDKGKSFDGFAPLGPWLVTRDEVADPQALPLWLELNGEPRQSGNTGSMIFGVAELVSYVSHVMTLLAGDVILTGTPAGVGMGCKPPRYLLPGDRLRLGVEGLGEQRYAVTGSD